MQRSRASGGGRGHGASSEENNERWLVSYADFVTLLLALFVVLFASSHIDQKRLQEFAERFGSGGHLRESTAVPKLGQTNRRRLLDTFYALRGKLRPEINGGEVNLSLQPRGLVISLRESGFFAAGRAELAGGAESALGKIAQSLQGSQALLRFEGHTDDVPIHTRQYPSNWHLSTARAVAVMRYFADELDRPPETMFVAGYAEHRPVEGNASEAGRAANRRVELVVMDQQ